MPRTVRLPGRFSAVVCIAAPLALLSCDGSPSGSADDPDACSITVAAASIAPGEELRVQGVPAAWPDSVLHAVAQAGGAASPVAVRRDSAGAVWAVAPIHPAAPFAGGSVALTVSAAGESCSAASLAVQPLASAPGTTGQVADALEGLVRTATGTFGFSPAELQGDPAAMDAKALPFAMAQFLVDHPQNPNSLRNLLDGSAPALQGQRPDPAVLDAVLASTDLLGALRRFQAGLDSLGPPPAPAPAGGEAAVAARPAALSNPGNITTAEQLHYWMGVQARAERGIAEFESAASELGLKLGTVAALPVAAASAPALLIGGAVLWTEGLFFDGMRALLPSQLDPLHADVPVTVLEEDAVQPGYVANAYLTARSGEWVVGWPKMVDGVLSVGGDALSGATSAFLATLNRLTRRTPALNGLVEDVFSDLFPVLAGAVNTYFGEALLPRDGFYVAGPIVYAPVDVFDPRFVQMRAAPEGVVRIDPADPFRFRPVATGQAELIIRTRPEYFHNRWSEKRVAVRVGAITVTIFPAGPVEIRPRGQRVFTAEVAGAADPAVDWTATCGTLDPGGGIVEFTAPDRETTCTLTAIHRARPDRRASVQIRVVDKVVVSISPPTATLRPRATQQFAATVEGSANGGVTWSADGGTITSGGLYTAPQDTGTYLVQARSTADAAAIAQAQVRVTQGSGRYRVVDLGPGASGVLRLTNSGAVLGNDGRVWHQGNWSDPGDAAAAIGSLMDMNAAGDLLGVNGIFADGTVIHLPSVLPTFINDRLQVAGLMSGGCTGCQNAFLWEDGVFRTLPYPPGWPAGQNRMNIYGRISSTGHVVGIATHFTNSSQPDLWAVFVSDGSATRTVADARFDLFPNSVNARGQVVGRRVPRNASTEQQAQAFIWDNGVVRELGVMAGKQLSFAYDINDLGQVVGYSGDSVRFFGDHSRSAAVLWEAATMRDLNELIEPESGWTLHIADQINDDGWITGSGTLNGETHRMFLLIPEE